METSPAIRPELAKIPIRGNKGSTSSPSVSHRAEANAHLNAAPVDAPAVSVAKFIKESTPKGQNLDQPDS